MICGSCNDCVNLFLVIYHDHGHCYRLSVAILTAPVVALGRPARTFWDSLVIYDQRLFCWHNRKGYTRWDFGSKRQQENFLFCAVSLFIAFVSACPDTELYNINNPYAVAHCISTTVRKGVEAKDLSGYCLV